MAAFRNRWDAGRQLALRLESLRLQRPIVLGLPPGGMPVAYEVASRLGAPLDVVVARKLAVPDHPEIGLGGIAEDGAIFVDTELASAFGVDAERLEHLRAAETIELGRRIAAYRRQRLPLDLRGRVAILIDDGLATGGTARAAIRSVRMRHPARVVFAAPVCPRWITQLVASEIAQVVCVCNPVGLGWIGAWYADDSQPTDERVVALIEHARSEVTEPSREDDVMQIRASIDTRTVEISVGDQELLGDLSVPDHALGIVLFAHGSGSGRHSPRNRAVANGLNRVGLATLLLDLLTVDEELIDRQTREHRFDIPLLARRLVVATDWLAAAHPTLPIGIFGASTGAAAAIIAAARRPERVRAIVSRGGRPDLADEALEMVRAPTLLIVGGADTVVIGLNRDALARMQSDVGTLQIVPGATHLFEEPGAMSEVAMQAQQWFLSHLPLPATAEHVRPGAPRR
jgi:putative phosphoribosyl transferase